MATSGDILGDDNDGHVRIGMTADNKESDDLYGLSEFPLSTSPSLSSPIFSSIKKSSSSVTSSSIQQNIQMTTQVTTRSTILADIFHGSALFSDMATAVHDPSLSSIDDKAVSGHSRNVTSSPNLISPSQQSSNALVTTTATAGVEKEKSLYLRRSICALKGHKWGDHVPPEEQEDCWESFRTIFRTLNPGHRSQLHHSILLSLSPCAQSGNLLPRRAYVHDVIPKRGEYGMNEATDPDAVQRLNSSALFYDPFAAKIASESSGVIDDILWPMGELCKCTIVLRNIFSVSLLLENIAICWEPYRESTSSDLVDEKEDHLLNYITCHMVAIPQTVLMPPNSPPILLELSVKLPSYPVKEFAEVTEESAEVIGKRRQIKLTGIQFSLYGSSVFVPIQEIASSMRLDNVCQCFKKAIVSDDSKEYPGKHMMIPEVDSDEAEMQSLIIGKRGSHNNNAAITISSEIKKVDIRIKGLGDLNNVIDVYQGEKREFSLFLKNASTQPIRNYRICAKKYYSELSTNRSKRAVLLDFSRDMRGSCADKSCKSPDTAKKHVYVNQFILSCQENDHGTDLGPEVSEIRCDEEIEIKMNLRLNSDMSWKKSEEVPTCH